jgi:hypothetical protein
VKEAFGEAQQLFEYCFDHSEGMLSVGIYISHQIHNEFRTYAPMFLGLTNQNVKIEDRMNITGN